MSSRVNRLSETRVLALFSSAHVIDDIYMNALPPLLPVLIDSHHLSYASAGLIVTLFTVTSSLSQPFIGYFIDRHHLSWTSSFGLVWVGLWMGLTGFAGKYPVLLAAAALAGIGPAMFHPHALATVSRIKTGVRGRVMAIFLIGGNLGFAIGPLLVGLLTKTWGIRGMALIAIPGIVMGLAIRMAGAAVSAENGEKMEPIRPADFSPAVTLMIVAVLRSWVYFSILSYLPSYFVLTGKTVLASTSSLTLMLLAGVAGQFAGGLLSDRYGRKEVTMASLLIAAPLLALFLHTRGTAALSFLILFGFSVMSSFSITIVMMHEIMHRHVGTASGIMIGLAVGLGGIGVLVTGSLADSFGIPFSMHVLIGILILAGLLTPTIPAVQGKTGQ